MRLILVAIVLLAINATAAVLDQPRVYFWTAVLNGVLAILVLLEGLLRARTSTKAAAPAAEPDAPAPAPPRRERNKQIDAEVVHFLGLLQQRGRFVDFLMEDVAGFSNEQVGAAARVVHQGCSGVLKEFFTIVPAHEAEEGATVTLEPGYDAAAYQLSGKVEGSPPFKGALAHHGWIAREVNLPRLVDSSRTPEKGHVIAPAEIEIK